MFAAAYRLIRLAWRHRRLIALVLTLLVSLWERHRHRLPTRLQKYEPPRRFVQPAQPQR